MADTVDLSAEFEAPAKVSAAPTQTTNESVDLMSEYAPPPKPEEHAIINDAVDKAHQFKKIAAAASDPNASPETRQQAAKATLGLMFNWFGDHFTTDVKENLSKQWETLNTPLVNIPQAPEASPEELAKYPAQPYIAGAYNGAAKVASGLTTPLNIGTLGAFGALTKLASSAGTVGTYAKTALTAIKAAFAAQMAKSAGEAAGAASVPEGKTAQEQTASVVEALGQSAMAALAAHSAGSDILTKGETTNANPKQSPTAEVRVGPETAPPRSEVAGGVTRESVVAPGESASQEAQAPQETPLDIGDRSGRPTGAAEEAIVAEQKCLIDEHLAQQAKAEGKPVLAEELIPPEKGTEEHAAITEELSQPNLKKEFTESKEPTAVMNAVVDAERQARGLEPVIESQRRSDPESWDAAMEKLNKNPDAGNELIESLRDDPRALNDVDVALIRHRRIVLTERFDKVAAEIVRAADAGDMKRVAELTPERDRVSDELTETDNAAKLSKSETGRGLRALRVLQNQDFSLAEMVTRRRAVNDGRQLSPEQMAEVQALHDKIASTQKAFDDYVAEQTAKKPRSRTSNTDQNVVSKFIDEQADAARQRIKERLTGARTSATLGADVLADYAIIGAQHIKNGIVDSVEFGKKMVDEFGEAIRPHLDDVFKMSQEKVSEAESQSTRLKSFKTRATNRITDLERRVEERDFSRKQLIELSKDKEANELQAKLDIAKEEYAAALERDRYENLSRIQKAKEQGIGFYDMARTLMTTGELSFVLRQGKMAALSHPVMSAKTLPTALRALISSPEAAHALNLEVLNHPDYAAAKAAKLHLLEHGQSLSKQEEILMAAQLAEKIPLVGKAVRGFNQAAEVYLNKLRFDLWRSMRDVGGLTAAEDRALATFVNESTGRGGLGALEPAGVPLGRIMFSPRFLASRLQLLVGHSMWGGTPRTRQIIAKEYARALVGMAAYYGAWELRNQFVDDKDKAKIETDPRSSDFGKIKIRNTRLDPLAGLSQLVVFGARTATGEKMSGKGKVTDIRGPKVPFGGEKWSEVATNFGRSKLHPVPGAIVNLFDGTDLGGQKVTVENQALNLSAPLTYMDIYQALEEQDLPEGVALALLATLGEGLQTYDAKHKKPVKKP